MIKKIPLANTSVSLPLVDGDDEDKDDPVVFYTIEARQTINYIVESTSFEAAWFGLVREEVPNEFVVYKIYIPEQEVTAASVDITSDAVAKIAYQIMDDGEDPAHMRYHGHSHVKMAVNPSVVDQEHMLDYIQDAEWFIRGIYNKKGEERVDIFDKRVMLTHQCVSTDVYEYAQTDEWFHKLDAIIGNQIKKRSWQAPQFGKNNRYSKKYGEQNVPVTPSQIAKTPGFVPSLYSTPSLSYLDSEDAEYEELMKDPFFAGRP